MDFLIKLKKIAIKRFLIIFYLIVIFSALASLLYTPITTSVSAIYHEHFGFDDCVSPTATISVPWGIASMTQVNGKNITTETTFKKLGFTYGNTVKIKRFSIMEDSVTICSIPSLLETSSTETSDSVNESDNQTNVPTITNNSPKQPLKLYQHLPDIFKVDVTICETLPDQTDPKQTETHCFKGDYQNINAQLHYGQQYDVMATIKDNDFVVKRDTFKIETIKYITLKPNMPGEGVGYKEKLVFQADQPLRSCSFTFLQGTTAVDATISVSNDLVTIATNKELAFNASYSVTITCENDLSTMEKPFSYSFKTTPQLEVSGYSPTFAYTNATICVSFNVPISWGIENITLDGVKGKFSKSGDNKVCTSVSNGGKNKTFTVTVPTSLGSDKAGSLIRSYTNKTTVNNYPIKNVLLGASYYKQKYTLSCEAASVKIALSAYGIYQSEEAIMNHIGYSSPTGKQCSDGSTPVTKANGILGCATGNTIWGDPQKGFVGQLGGSSASTGWGADNGPVVQGAKAFAGGSYTLNGADWHTPLQEVTKGHPVVYWTENKTRTASVNECWYTNEGKRVCWKSTHVKTIVGHTYNSDTGVYSNITIYDPLYGILRLSQNDFINSWYSYGGMGIVVVR